MPTDADKLQTAISALEAQRATLGDAIVEVSLAKLRAQLAALGAAAAPERLLKQVTVMFLDAVGSTQLSQHLDPEDIQTVMDGLLAEGTQIVQDFGGRVLQYAGDNLLAAFGAERIQEDDAERAVRAGLALLAAGQRHGAAVQRRFGREGFGVRLGLHTGAVLLGGGVDGDGTIRGLTVNIAARMEQSAPPGGLRISHDTWQHVRGVFDLSAQPPLLVKGHDAPILTYLVTGAKPRAFRLLRRGVQGLATPMVGRDGELARLRALLDDAAALQQPRGLTLLADAGLGKSRLIQAFQDAIELDARRIWLLLGRADPAQRLQPYGLLRNLLDWRLQIADSDSADTARRKLVDGLTPWLSDGTEGSAADQVRALGQLIGMAFEADAGAPVLSPQQLRDRAFAAAAAWLRGLAQGTAGGPGGPVVMLLEDLHWADDGSLDFVEHLLGLAAPLPLAVVVTARPNLLERRAHWAQRLAVVALAPLEGSPAGALAAALLARIDAPPVALHQLLVGQAAGNPFYMEELLGMLIDDGVVDTAGPRWQVRGERLRLARLPTTLVGVLQARLDALPPAERAALQQASIVGPVFWDHAVDALAAGTSAAVPGLRDKALVVGHASSAFEGAAESAFKHHLLHQVTYETVLKATRREGHARAARWLAERVGDRADEYLAVTADHFERAGDGPKALEYLHRAASAASERFANAEALAYVERALALPEAAAPRERHALRGLQAGVADTMGLRDLQSAALDEQASLAEALDDDLLRARNLFDRALLADRRGQAAASEALSRQLLQATALRGPAHLASQAHGQLAWCNFVRGDTAQALDHGRQALHWGSMAARPADPVATPPLPLPEIQACVLLSFIHQNLFAIDEAHAVLQRGLPLAQAAGNLRLQALMLQSLGTIAGLLEDWAGSHAQHEEVLAIARRIGWLSMQLMQLWNLAQCLLNMGDTAAAMARVEESMRLCERSEDPSMLARGWFLRGQIHARQGDSALALAACADARSRCQALGEAAWVDAITATMAGLHLAADEGTLALAEADQVLASLAAGNSLEGIGAAVSVGWEIYQVLAAVGDARAQAQLEAVHRALTDKAARIADRAMRLRLLQGVPTHRQILATWAARRP